MPRPRLFPISLVPLYAGELVLVVDVVHKVADKMDYVVLGDRPQNVELAVG